MTPASPTRPILATIALIGIVLLIAFCGGRPDAGTDTDRAAASSRSPDHASQVLEP